VFMGAGEVFGINSIGLDGVPVGYVSSVEDLLDLEIPKVELPDGSSRRVSIRDLVSLRLVPMN
jgi:hypothetical protein